MSAPLLREETRAAGGGEGGGHQATGRGGRHQGKNR